MGKRTTNLGHGVLVFRNDALDVHRYKLPPTFLLNDELARASAGRSCYLFVSTAHQSGGIVALFLSEEADSSQASSERAALEVARRTSLWHDFPRAKELGEREISIAELREVQARTIAALKNAARR